ncbi:MAG: hypothetical protein PHG16_10030 [Lachnospiraceae bacterium]|nr:hypothetical protein [Lachnospiraceae bacterium]
MYKLVYNIFSDVAVFRIMVILGLPLTIILVIMFCMKSNRDERGWKIIGKASMITFIYFIIIVNVIAKVTGAREMNWDVFTVDTTRLFFFNIIQTLYDTVLLVEIVAISILKKIE